jgi:hypothetical protein
VAESKAERGGRIRGLGGMFAPISCQIVTTWTFGRIYNGISPRSCMNMQRGDDA